MHVRFGFKTIRGIRVLLLLSVILGSVAIAIPASPAAAADCVAPNPVPTSVARADSKADATPVTADGAGQKSEVEQLRDSLTNLVKTVAACKSEGDFETMSTLVTETYLGQVYGGGPKMSRESFLAMAEGLPTLRVRFRNFDDLSIVGPRTAKANVTLVVAKQVTFERLT